MGCVCVPKASFYCGWAMCCQAPLSAAVICKIKHKLRWPEQFSSSGLAEGDPQPKKGLKVNLGRFWSLVPPGGLLIHPCSLWNFAFPCAWLYCTPAEASKIPDKSPWETADKVLLLFHYCPIDVPVGLYPMEELLLYAILCTGNFWVEKSRTKPLKAQCLESDHRVESVIKKHFSQRQNSALKKHPESSGLSIPFMSHFHPEILPHFIKAMVKERRKREKPVVAGTKIPASAFLSPLPP